MDVNTGNVLAMASYPSFDPNWFINGLTPEQVDYLMKSDEAADATKPKQGEPCVKTMQDDLNGAIYNSIIFNRERIENLEDNLVTLRHNMAGLDAKISALRERVDNVPTPKPKRTRMDVLLDVFPQAVMDGDVPALCPRSIVNGISLQYCAKATCSDCKREYWLQ